jgi:hypothetical protein
MQVNDCKLIKKDAKKREAEEELTFRKRAKVIFINFIKDNGINIIQKCAFDS